MVIRYTVLLAWLVLSSTVCHAVPRINLFRPSDRPLMPEPITMPVDACGWAGQLSIGYEGAYRVKAFQGEDAFEQQADLNIGLPDRRTCIFDIFGDRHNLLGGLKGADSPTAMGQLAQTFNRNDEAGFQGLYCPQGCLRVPLNLLLAQRLYFKHGLSLAFYLPVIRAELTDVTWEPVGDKKTGEERAVPRLLERVELVTGMHLGGWTRTGVGDLVIQGAWMRDFAQSRPLLYNVRVLTRLGLMIPTGKKKDEDLLLAFPFGNDGSWGVQFAGGIDLSFGYTLRGGLDVEFIYQFGTTRERRVKAAEGQNDLLLYQKACVFREPGLGQQYNLYLESCNLFYNTSLKLNYQFLKQNDDRIDLGTNRINPRIANSSETLFDWSAHSLIFMVNYDAWRDYDWRTSTYPASWYPSVRAWAKWGFNGKRAFVANTIGLQFNLAF